MSRYAVGLDIGGTRMKLGTVNLETGEIGPVDVADTVRDSEPGFFERIREAVDENLKKAGVERSQIEGVGVSIGTYVFEDGCIDGMSCFVPFLKEGYPLLPKLEEALELPVRADNDVRLIALAETLHGIGKGYKKTMTITLGSGVGIGICENGKPYGTEAFCHLAGHVKVRGNYIEALDSEPCYCHLHGCLESTCSGTSLEKYVKSVFGPEMDNRKFFELARQGNEEALHHLNWYLDMLAEGLNQYIYVYCPDVIILGGGITRGLQHYQEELNRRITAQVHSRQHTEVRFSELMEASGVLGAAMLFGVQTV